MAELVRGTFNSAGDVTDGGKFTHSGTGSLSIYGGTTPPEGSNYLLHFGGGNDYNTYTPASGVGNCSICFYFNLGSVNADMVSGPTMWNSSPGTFFSMNIDNNNQALSFQYVNSLGTTVVLGEIFRPVPSVWYQIEMLHNNGVSVGWKIWDVYGENPKSAGGSSTSNIRALNVERSDFGGLNNPGGSQAYAFDVYRMGDAGYLGPLQLGGSASKIVSFAKFKKPKLKNYWLKRNAA